MYMHGPLGVHPTHPPTRFFVLPPFPSQESDLDRIIGSSQPLTDQHFQYFLYQVGVPRAKQARARAGQGGPRAY